MSSISTSNSFSTSPSSNKGISGLVSGLDTEGMVESMLSGIQKKIDDQNALKSQVTWKQEIYRGVISDINAFQTKFFKSGSTNFLSNSFYNAMSAVTKSSSIKVTADSTASTGRTTLKVEQLASKTTMKSGGEVSGILKGDMDLSALTDKRVFFDVGGTEVEVDLSSGTSTPLTSQEIADKLNDALGSHGVTASVKYDKLTIQSTGTVQVSGKSSTLGLSMLGCYGGSKATFNQDEGYYKMSMNLSPDTKPTVDIQLDDVKKTITLEGNTEAELRDNLQKSIDRAFGDGQISVGGTGAGLELTTPVKGRQIVISGSDAGLEALGMTSQQSNKVTTSTKLKDLNFGTKLMGGKFGFSINGESFTFDENDTLSTILTKVNASEANVRITYAPGDDKFTIESKDSGAGYEMKIEDTEGNLMTAMFGNLGGSSAPAKASSKTLTVNTVTGSMSDSSTFKGGAFVLNVDGKDYTINLPEKDDGATYSKSEMIRGINGSLATMFGYEKNGQQSIELVTGSGNEVLLKANNNAQVKFAAAPTDADELEANAAAALGFSEKNNLATDATSLADLNITAPAGVTTLGQLLSGTGATVVDGKVTFGSISDASALTDDVKIALFGTKDFGDFATTDTANLVGGQNAKLTINGVETERSTNNFTVNGLNIELLETSKNSSGTFDDIVIDTSRDTDQIFEGVKSFVEDYNKLIDKLNGLVDAKATYKDYPPLTSAQKKEMSQSEIELWEEKSKEGLIRKDSSISTFLSGMRTALYTKPEGANYGIYDFGIETSSDWKDQGKLVIKDETQLKTMIANNTADFQKLFGEAKDGIMSQINTIIDATAKTSSGAKGSLVELAGYSGKASDTDNTLSKQLRDIQDKIKSLTNTYNKQKNRYWAEFNNMEKALQQMNSQSMWLTQQFG